MAGCESRTQPGACRATELVVRDGKDPYVIDSGSYRFFTRRVELHRFDVRPYVLSVPVQEVSTADGISVKVSITAIARVVDPTKKLLGQQEADGRLYLALQLAVRTAVAALSLDVVVAARTSLTDQLVVVIEDVSDTGVALERIAVRDVIVPAEIKRAQAQVVMARAEGQAALERARGETAALRSLANAARLAAEQPALLQLRSVQTLAAGSGNTVVLGNAATLPAT